MSKIKAGLVQIDFKPAFFYNQIDMLVEPYGDESTSISEFNFPGSQKLKNNLRDNYISWIKLKVLAVIKKAIALKVDILVFPEYSIPVFILDDMVKAIRNSDIVIVAGTHIVANANCTLPPNYPDAKSILGCAMCPVLTSAGVSQYTLKNHKAATEVNSIHIPKVPINDTFNMGKFTMQIKICIDAITCDSGVAFDKLNKEILVIPSWSRSTEPFQALATLSKFNEVPVIYANCASIGGSVISGAFSRYSDHWFADKTTTIPVPKNVECMVTTTIDLDRMYNAIGTVNTVEAISIDEIVNIFYNLEESHRITVNSITDYLGHFDTQTKCNIINQCTDPILAKKIRYLQLVEENGLLDKTEALKTLEFIRVNSISLKQLMSENSKQALNMIAANMQQAGSEEKLYYNLSKLSEYLAITKNSSIQQVNIMDDDNLFSGRDDEISGISQFFNSRNNVLLLHGIRGIGKTKLIKKISTKVLPTPSPWEIKYIELEKGVGYELLFDQLSYALNLPYIEQKGTTPEDISGKIFEFIEQRAPIALIIDDVHNCTEVNGIFSDSRLKEFLFSFIKHTQSSEKLKLILTSNRKIADIESIRVLPTAVSRLNDSDVRFVVSYCYRKITNSTKSFEISDNIINIIYGNPLAAILVAQLIDENKLHEFELKKDLFQRFQERLIKNLLGEVNLSQDETSLMKLLSATKTAVEIEFIKKEYTYLIPAIDSLANRFLLEKTDQYVKVHPLFKEYYYDLLDLKERVDYHRILASYYDDILNTHKDKKTKTDPTLLANIIYHYAGSLQMDKVKQYTRYIEELKPVADRLFRDKNYEDAVRYYRMIYEATGEQRTDVLLRMAQSYVYCSKIENAEKFFKLAITANPRGAYLWAGYAISLSSKKNYIPMAAKYADEAEEVYLKYGNNLEWELAKIKFAQARSCRFENYEKALRLYEEACTLEPTSVYYLCMFSMFLYAHGNKEKAIEKYNIAKNIDPDYEFLKRLKDKFNECTNCLGKESSFSEDTLESDGLIE